MAKYDVVSKTVVLTAVAGLSIGTPTQAQDTTDQPPATEERSRVDTIVDLVETTEPIRTRDRVDHELLVVRRIDVVDSNGVIRATIGGELPNPIIEGVQYERIGSGGGIMLRDSEGNERGGYAYFGDFERSIITIDSDLGEAVSIGASDDGEASINLWTRPEELTSDRMPGVNLPGGDSSMPIRMLVDKDGKGSVALLDKNNRERLRFSLADDGAGQIEFLDAEGEVVSEIVPERDARSD